MGWWNNKKQKPEYTALDISTAASILPIPIVWGTNRIAPNCVFYNNFQAHQQKKSGGKGGAFGSGTSQGYTYSADLALALCEGPIKGLGFVWVDRLIFAAFGDLVPVWSAADGTVSFLWLFEGTTPQDTWGYFAALYPTYDLNLQGTAYLAAADFDLGSSASIGQLGCEVHGVLAYSGANSLDADPAKVIYDFLTSAQYGAGFDAASIDTTTLFGSGGDASVQTYCKAMGISFSPALENQEQGSSILTRWLQLLNTAAVWSGDVLRFVPYGDQAIAQGLVLVTSQPLTIPTNPDNVPGGFGFGFIILSPPGGLVAVLSIKYAFAYYGATLIPVFAIPQNQGEYWVVGDTIYFCQADIGQAIIITYEYFNATGYNPSLTPVYDLTDADYFDDGGDHDPLVCERVDPYTLPTIMRIEVRSRANSYAGVTVEARDQSQIEVYGPRVATTVEAHEICDELNVGPVVAQAILQRQLYVRAKFRFKLSWEFCLLDPMDIVSLTDAGLGLDHYPVRITSIEEDDKGILSIEAEELVYGISTPGINPGGGTTPIPIDRSATASPVNPPLIFEPPAAYSSVAEVLIGASASLKSGVVDPNWGGAVIWASLDDVNYSEIATIAKPARQGSLTASLPLAHGWDTADTLAVDLTESGGTLTSVSQAAAQAGATLCLIDQEFVAFETATLTAANKYSLTGLARGLYGTSPATHVSGAPFCMVDAAIITETLPASWIGATVYLKFQSFNIFGEGFQSLAACQAYIFQPGAPAIVHPIVAQLTTGLPLDLGLVSSPPTVGDDMGTVSQAATGAMDLGNVTVSHLIAAALISGSPVDLGAVSASATTRDDFGTVSDTATQTLELGIGV